MKLTTLAAGVAAAALAGLLAAATAPAARAQGEESGTPGEWRYTVTPYVWFASVEGTLGARDRTVPMEASFSDIVGDLRFAGMLTFQARRDRLALLLDVFYTDVQDAVGLPPVGGQPYARGRGTQQAFVASPMVVWRVAGDDTSYAEVLGGLRFWSLENRVEFLDGAGGAPDLRFSSRPTWVDPIVGGRLRTALCRDWSAALTGDLGGFDVGSRFTWQLAGTFHWAVGSGNSVVLGYRHLDVDYRSGGTVYDVRQSGPLLGFTFRL